MPFRGQPKNVMKTLMNQLKLRFPILQSRQAREQAYLNAASDISDLERRMRRLEARSGWLAAPSDRVSQVRS
jgi:Protein of unknown function (DUF3563)